MNVVMTGDGRFIEVQGTAEGAPFSRASHDAPAGAGRDRHPPPRRDAAGPARGPDRVTGPAPAAAARGHHQPRQARRDPRHPRRDADHPRHARRPSRRRRTRGDRRDLRGQRAPEGALLRRGDRRAHRGRGTPASRSTRWTGSRECARRDSTGSPYAEKFAAIRRMLAERGADGSAARFVCALALARPSSPDGSAGRPTNPAGARAVPRRELLARPSSPDDSAGRPTNPAGARAVPRRELLARPSSPDGSAVLWEAAGVVEGRVQLPPRGEGGFGLRPHLPLPPPTAARWPR